MEKVGQRGNTTEPVAWFKPENCLDAMSLRRDAKRPPDLMPLNHLIRSQAIPLVGFRWETDRKIDGTERRSRATKLMARTNCVARRYRAIWKSSRRTPLFLMPPPSAW